MCGGADPVDVTDADLVRRAAAGDRESFGEVFERYHDVVYRFARAMTGSREAAEDVTQEVFVVLMRDLRRYLPERAALSTYLYGVARNVSRDRVRRDGRFLSFLSRAATPTGDVPSADPVARMVSVEAGAEVRRALARIPLKYREVVILCDVHDLSYAEVGTVLGASTGAVRSRLHRGRQLLRQRLSGPAQIGMGAPSRHSVRR
jgi:RNA polymerase sigma-70 factor (ECF subfamily)